MIKFNTPKLTPYLFQPMKTISIVIMKPTLTKEYLLDMWVLYSR